MERSPSLSRIRYVCCAYFLWSAYIITTFRRDCAAQDKYASVSAFSPICNPIECPWGVKAFTNYLGEDKEQWKQYDATELVRERGPFPKFDILIDQGAGDSFLESTHHQKV